MLHELDKFFYGLSIFENWKVLVISTLLISRLKLVVSSNVFSRFIVNLFGVFLHELAHFIVAFILLAKPYNFSIFPSDIRFGPSGSIYAKNVRWWNALPIALAPLFLIILVYYLDAWFLGFLDMHKLSHQIVYIFFLSIVLDNAIPSIQDIKNILYYPKGMIFYGLLLLVLFVASKMW